MFNILKWDFLKSRRGSYARHCLEGQERKRKNGDFAQIDSAYRPKHAEPNKEKRSEHDEEDAEILFRYIVKVVNEGKVGEEL